jgi:hypothetical protein
MYILYYDFYLPTVHRKPLPARLPFRWSTPAGRPARPPGPACLASPTPARSLLAVSTTYRGNKGVSDLHRVAREGKRTRTQVPAAVLPRRPRPSSGRVGGLNFESHSHRWVYAARMPARPPPPRLCCWAPWMPRSILYFRQRRPTGFVFLSHWTLVALALKVVGNEN